MEPIVQLVAILTGVVAIAFYVWYLWVHGGMDAEWKSLVKRHNEEQDELARLRRMWDIECA